MGDEYSGMTVASFVLGVVGFLGLNLLLFIPGILSIVFGFVGLKRIKQNKKLKGRGLAIAGIVISFAFLLIIPIIFGMLWVVVRNVTMAGSLG